MSPIDPPAPERAGSVRQSACLRVHGLGEPVLGVFHLHQPDPPEQPLGYGRARLSDHGVAGVVVRQHEDGVRSRRRLGNLPRLLERRGQRLVADHVDAAGEKRLCRRRMHMVRCDDRDRLHAVGPRRLALGHRLEVVVDPVLGEAEGLSGLPRPLRRRRQGAGDEIEGAVEPRGHPVDGADEGVLAAADHAEPDRCRRIAGRSADHRFSPRGRAAAGWRPYRSRCRRNRRRPCP